MKNSLLLPIVFSVSFLLQSCGEEISTPPKSLPKIDGDRTLAIAKEICTIEKRYSGSPGAIKNIEFISSKLREMNVPFTRDDWREETPVGTLDFVNLIAEVEGKKKDYILLGAHHDTKYFESDPNFMGANDGASATALLLGMIDALRKAESKPDFSLRFAFIDGEECRFEYSEKDGLHGSRRLASKVAAEKSPACAAVIILDMIGDKDLLVEIPRNSTPSLADEVMNAAKICGSEKYFTFSQKYILDDHDPFLQAGIPAIDLIDFSFGPSNLYWHSSEDSFDKLSPDSLAIVGDTVIRVLYTFKDKHRKL